ncbi:hypothetical protein AB0C51_21460 [Streptomyces pathocidini]|uniref:hypothetical protein n=1 Tax=Streptomyces pathocidini TaxID=1650571 RepID=UPI0033DF3F0A
MTRKGSAGFRARRAAVVAVREALERGEVPVEAPELVQGDPGEFWVWPDGRVFVRAPRGTGLQMVVGGSEGGEWWVAPPWADDMSRLCHWRAADGSRAVMDEV